MKHQHNHFRPLMVRFTEVRSGDLTFISSKAGMVVALPKVITCPNTIRCVEVNRHQVMQVLDRVAVVLLLYAAAVVTVGTRCRNMHQNGLVTTWDVISSCTCTITQNSKSRLWLLQHLQLALLHLAAPTSHVSIPNHYISCINIGLLLSEAEGSRRRCD